MWVLPGIKAARRRAKALSPNAKISGYRRHWAGVGSKIERPCMAYVRLVHSIVS